MKDGRRLHSFQHVQKIQQHSNFEYGKQRDCVIRGPSTKVVQIHMLIVQPVNHVYRFDKLYGYFLIGFNPTF